MLTFENGIRGSLPIAKYWQSLDRLIQKPRISTSFWPSEVTADVVIDNKVVTYGACGRAIMYKMCNELPQLRTYLSEMRFEMGNLSEYTNIKNAQYFMDEIYPQVRIKIPLKELEFSGYIDAIYKPHNMNKYIIGEYKSSYGYYYEKMMNKGEFKPENAMQLGIYMFGIRYLDVLKDFNPSIGQANTSHGSLIYTSRGNCEIAPDVLVDIKKYDLNGKTYHGIYVASEKVQADPLVTVEAIYNKMQIIHQACEDQILPPRDYIIGLDDKYAEDYINRNILTKEEVYKRVKSTKDRDKMDWQCSYCDFKKQCKSDMLPQSPAVNMELARNKMQTLAADFYSRYGYDLNKLHKDYSSDAKNTKDEEEKE